MSPSTIRQVRRAFAQRGFKPVFDVPGYEFHGTLKAAGLDIPVRAIYEDREFSALPAILIDDGFKLPRDVVPHVSETGRVCFIDHNRFSVDRHSAAGEALAFLDRATQTLHVGLTNSPENAVAEELIPTWSDAVFYMECGEREGFAKLNPRGVAPELHIVAAARASEANMFCVLTPNRLSFTTDQKRPTTFGEFIEWLKHWDAHAAAKLIGGLGQLSSADPFAIVIASNGAVGARLLVSKRGQVRAFSRPEWWQHVLGGALGRSIPIERFGARRSDMDHLLGRNGEAGVAPLSGKKIVLVGCGSIGGFLSHALAQFGAGLGAGHLTLIDPDLLTAANTGRHFLGHRDRGENKAVACRARILEDLPSLNVSAVPLSINGESSRFDQADLVIDATGEEAVSEMLNDWRLRRLKGGRSAPELLHVWLEGQGAAARSYLNAALAQACYRCLEPVRGEPRFRVLKEGAPQDLAGTCGDLPFTPYGPSAPMIASGLAAQQAAEWGLGRVDNRFRTQRVDLSQTKECKPSNPSKATNCPACGS